MTWLNHSLICTQNSTTSVIITSVISSSYVSQHPSCPFVHLLNLQYVSLSPHEPGRYACILQDGDTFGNVPDDWLEDCTRVNEDIKAILPSPGTGETLKAQTFSAVRPAANPKMLRKLATILTVPGVHIRRRTNVGRLDSKDSGSIRSETDEVVNIGGGGEEEGREV
jgi:hypothetical protein